MDDPFVLISSSFWMMLGYVLSWWWLIAPPALFFVFWELWNKYIVDCYIGKIEWTSFELKVPRDLLKTPQAMEQIFAGLHAIQKGGNLIETYWDGYVQGWISLEIVGAEMESEIHFIIRAPSKFRNLLESQMYGQYPQAEITEIEDYVNFIPPNIPNEKYNLWGTEMILAKEDAYPIKTYIDFSLEKEEEEMRKIDPLSSLTELLSKLKSGEQIWIQILIKPAGTEWKKKGEELVNKLLGRKTPEKGIWLIEHLRDMAGWARDAVVHGIISELTPAKAAKEASMSNLSPGQKNVIEAIEKNISKLGFETCIRWIYLGRSDIFNPANIGAVMGVFKQFNTLNLNGFKPNGDTKTSVDYFFKQRREFILKKRIFNDYKKRKFPSRSSGRTFVFNVEELATLYHLPGLTAAAPMMPRVEAKRGEPPAGLPV